MPFVNSPPKVTPLELKYNIDQMILKELSNLESRTILFSIVNQSKYRELN